MRVWLRENRGLIVFVLCLGMFRTAIADWNPIPSGSMRPTILEGDVVLVNRLAYDFKVPLTDVSVKRLGEPQRGDIVTFSSPRDGTRLIKRLVGIPGDAIEMREEVLFVNGVAAAYTDLSIHSEPSSFGQHVEAARATETVAGSRRSVQFLRGVASRRTFGPLVVPQDQYFMLGDNRDNSEDSRFIGFVPRSMLIGRAERVALSSNILGNWMPRFERTAKSLR